MNPALLWIAQGFGVGRIPVAPGTFGSLLGVGWFALLVSSGSAGIFFLTTLGGIVLSVWLCGQAERTLNAKDPGSGVLDEIVAMPVCFSGWLLANAASHSSWPAAAYFFRKETWLLTLAAFALFRLFDIWKPWPVRQSQALAGGFGVTLDDVLAAAYTAVIIGISANWIITPP